MESEFTCGDNICEPGEKYLCASDCQKTNCFSICQEKDFDYANCRSTPSNPTLPFCEEKEQNQGLGYCAEGKACCCSSEEIEEKQQEQEEPKQQEKKKRNLFSIIWRWIKELFSAIF